MKQVPICAPEHVDEVRHQHPHHPMPSEDDFFEAAEVFRQLCDGTRLKLLWLLSVGETCGCDLAETLGITAPAVSHHLRSLRQAGLISYRREGKVVYYSLAKNNNGMRVRHMLIDALAGGIETGEEKHG
jgi:DNA-binding transcriptional ArsR family regulator